jgi:hypothetical protein
MLKTISAALLAASVIAAPAFAAGTGKTAQTSTVKTEQAPAINDAQAKTGVKADAKIGAKTSSKAGSKAGALNANAKMHRHHHKYHKTGALKSKKHLGFNGAVKTKSSNAKLGKTNAHVSKIHASKSHSKVSFKHMAPATKRG